MAKRKAQLTKKTKDSKRKRVYRWKYSVIAQCIILFTVVSPPKHDEPVQRRQPLTGFNPTYGMSTRLPNGAGCLKTGWPLLNGFSMFAFTQTIQPDLLTQFVFHPGLKIGFKWDAIFIKRVFFIRIVSLLELK
jgi:hypothetical protein